MIEKISIGGFKRFIQHDFCLAPLTVLAGLNGAGKTTLIHAILLMKESEGTVLGGELPLQVDERLQLGTAESVRNWAAKENISFSATFDTGKLAEWNLQVPSDAEALYLTVKKRPLIKNSPFVGGARGFTYLCAERLGPRSNLSDSPVGADSLEVGQKGQFCAQVLEKLGGKPSIYPNRTHPEKTSADISLLKYEVESWLSEITTPVEIGTIPSSGSAMSALQFRTLGGDWVRAPNMGFGVSYALPIVLAGLIASNGGLLVVENPEAHLHPAGQSRMGSFLAWLAGKGVQIILETHSDHVLNGVRRAIADLNYLTHDNAIVNYFGSNADNVPEVNELRFSSSGGISDWPPGFFDQYQLDVASLGRARRKG
jgi:predicted ATPase